MLSGIVAEAALEGPNRSGGNKRTGTLSPTGFVIAAQPLPREQRAKQNQARSEAAFRHASRPDLIVARVIWPPGDPPLHLSGPAEPGRRRNRVASGHVDQDRRIDRQRRQWQ